MANPISFLAREAAGRLSGQVIYVAGGPLRLKDDHRADTGRPPASGSTRSWRRMTRGKLPKQEFLGAQFDAAWPGCTSRGPAASA